MGSSRVELVNDDGGNADMSDEDQVLNELLVKLFKDIMEIEEKWLITREFKDISVNDMHIIEAVGVEEPKSISMVAKLLDVTTGTLSKAIDSLVRKLYICRERSREDKRVVYISLTDKGEKAYYHHENFHRKMIDHTKEGLDEQEAKVLVCSLAKLNDYFHSIYKQV